MTEKNNEEVRQTIRVEREETGFRLDAALASRFPRVSRSRWQERIRAGDVLVDGLSARAARRVKEGESIEFRFERREEPSVNEDYRVLYEDDDILAIDKPWDLPVHPSGVYFKHTLHALLKRDRGEDFVSYFAHRLDRETSGVLLMGKNKDAAFFLHECFLSGRVRKEYLVLAGGDFPERLDARGWIGPDDQSPVRKKMKFVAGKFAPDDERFRGARTVFRLLGRPAGVNLIHVRLYTGRLHQIRATLCSLGYPVVGDRLYGPDDRLYLKFIQDLETPEDRKLLGMERTALHCRRMILPHPNGSVLRLVSSPPRDMLAFMRRNAGEA